MPFEFDSFLFGLLTGFFVGLPVGLSWLFV